MPWHVDGVAAASSELVFRRHAARALTKPGRACPASVIDPFGNVLGFMRSRHYLESSTPEQAS